MKIQYSLPKDEGFFGAYASLTPTLVKLGYLAQVISALTEFGIIFALVKGSLQDFFPAAAPVAGLFGAIVGTGFLEIGLRQFIPYSVRAILYRRFAGLHLFISCFVFVVTLGLLASSGYLSFQGSKELVKATAPAPKLASLAPVDSLAQQRKGEALAQWQKDSLEVVARFSPALAAVKAKHEAQANQEALALRRWEARERTAGRKYGSQKAGIKARIAAIQATEAAEIAQMEGSKALALEAALKARNKALEGITAERQQQRQRLETKNAKAEATNAQQVKKYGGGLAWFTVICLGVLLLSVAIDEMHKKGSGIEEVALPNQYYFSQGILEEFFGMLSDKLNYHCREFIRRQAAKTPEPPAPEEAPTLWEISKQGMKRKAAGQQQAQPQQAAAEPQQEEPGYFSMFESAFSPNGHHQNGHSNGKPLNNSAPAFATTQAPRRPIGFKPQLTHSVNNAMHYSPPGPVVEIVREVDKNSIPCLQCSALFKPRTTWQKFCSVDCREAFHEAKHGQPFNPGQYRKIKKRKQ